MTGKVSYVTQYWADKTGLTAAVMKQPARQLYGDIIFD